MGMHSLIYSLLLFQRVVGVSNGDTFQAKRTEVRTPDILRQHGILEGYI